MSECHQWMSSSIEFIYFLLLTCIVHIFWSFSKFFSSIIFLTCCSTKGYLTNSLLHSDLQRNSNSLEFSFDSCSIPCLQFCSCNLSVIFVVIDEYVIYFALRDNIIYFSVSCPTSSSPSQNTEQSRRHRWHH